MTEQGIVKLVKRVTKETKQALLRTITSTSSSFISSSYSFWSYCLLIFVAGSCSSGVLVNYNHN